MGSLSQFGASCSLATNAPKNIRSELTSKDVKHTVLQVANDLLEKSGIIETSADRLGKPDSADSMDEYAQEDEEPEDDDQSFDEQDLEEMRIREKKQQEIKEHIEKLMNSHK